MLIKETDAESRLASPLNLINRLDRYKTSRSGLSLVPRDGNSSVVSLPPKIDDLIENVDIKLKTNEITEDALDLISKTVKELKLRVSEVDKPEKLSRIATDMSKVINNFKESDRAKNNQVHLHLHAPEQKKLSDYKTIDV